MASCIRVRDICLRVGTIIYLLAFMLAYSPVMAAEPKRVMILHSFGQHFKPWSDYASAIRSELDRQSTWPLNLTEHSLIAARFGGDNPEGPFVEYLRTLYAKERCDLIISIGAPAATFVQTYRQQLFPTTPMVLTVVDQRRVQFSLLTPNDAVAAVSIDYFGAINNILRVLPDTKNVAVVVGNSPIEKYWREEIGREVQPFADRIAFTWYNHLSFADVLKHAAALPPQSAIFWELMIVDAAGMAHEEGKALRRLHAVANAPIFSYTDAFFGREIVGGPLVPVLEHARQVAEVAVRILGGEKAGDIKTPPVGFGTPKFDWREMQRWGISESRLPPGSEIHFRELTVWDRYRWQIISVAMALLLQSALISWLLIERFWRRTAEIESRRRMLEVVHLNRSAQAGALSASFAHELSQPLGAIMINAETAVRMLDAKPVEVDRLRELLTDIREADENATEIILNVRGLLKRRSEIKLQEFDLNEVIADALQMLSAEAAKRNVTLHVNGIQQPLLVRADRIHLQQVILNLARNGMDAMSDTASDARRLTIQTALPEGAEVEVSVIDSGMGIPKHKLGEIFDTFYTTKAQGTGLGLSIVRTIIESYGGKIWAENRAGGGAIFRFTLPLVR